MVDFVKLNSEEGRSEAQLAKERVEKEHTAERRSLLSGLIMMSALDMQKKLQDPERSLLGTLRKSWQQGMLCPTAAQMRWMLDILTKNGKISDGTIKPIFGELPDVDGNFVAVSDGERWVGKEPEEYMLRTFSERWSEGSEGYSIHFRAKKNEYDVEFASVEADQVYSGEYTDPKFMMVDPLLLDECKQIYRELERCGIRYPLESKAREIIWELQGAFLSPSLCALRKGERDHLKSLLSDDTRKFFQPEDYRNVVDIFTRGTRLFRHVAPLTVIQRVKDGLVRESRECEHDGESGSKLLEP